MRIRKPGKVREGIWCLGREESGVYLLEGDDSSMIVSGGMSYIVSDILQQFNEFGIDEKRIKKLLILHSHFDHVGIVPFIKRRHPKIEVYASQRGWEVLQMDKAILTINEFGRNVARRMGKGDVYSAYDLEWRKDVSGTTIREGDRIDLGGLEVSILEIPGHSSCCIAAYVPELKALFPTDGGGIPFDKTIVSSGNSNYTQYQQSLERLKDLEVDYYCADHYGYVTGRRPGNSSRSRSRWRRRTVPGWRRSTAPLEILMPRPKNLLLPSIKKTLTTSSLPKSFSMYIDRWCDTWLR